MAKVNFKCTTTTVLFDDILGGDYFIFDNKLYLKVGEINAFSFEENELMLFSRKTRVFLKSGNDIEITVK